MAMSNFDRMVISSQEQIAFMTENFALLLLELKAVYLLDKLRVNFPKINSENI
jgi:hypothetical protein